jgi:PAS domain S-box-containing protein
LSSKPSDGRPATAQSAVDQACYRLLAENTADIIARCDMKGILTYVSPSCRSYGYEPEELVGQPGDVNVHPEDRTRFLANTADLLADRPVDRAADREHRFRTRGRGWVWLEGSPQIVRDEAGVPMEILSVFRDVTERKSKVELFENAFHHAPIGMALVSLEGEFLKINAAFCRIVGYPEPEMLALDFQAITHPDDLHADLDLLTRVVAGEIPSYQMDKRYLRSDGAVVWARLSVSLVRDADGQPKHFVSQVEDLSAHVAAQAALTQRTLDLEAAKAAALTTNKLMRAAEEIAHMGYWTWDVATRTATWSEETWRILGLKPDAEGPNFTRVNAMRHPEDREPAARVFEAALKTGEPFNNEFRIILPGGEVRHLLSRGIVTMEAGRAKSVFGVMMDITELKRAEAAVRDSEARYRLLTDNATDVIACYGTDAVFTFLSPSLASVMGYEPGELVGQPVTAFMHPQDIGPTLRRFAAYLRRGRTAEPIRFEYRAYRKDGALVWLEAQAKAIYGDQGQIVEFQDVVRDITERKAVEAALADSEMRYRVIAENCTDVITRTNLKGILTYVSPSITQVAGYEVDELVGLDAAIFMHPDEVEQTREAYRRTLNGDRVEGGPVTYRARHKTGAWIWLESNPTLVRDAQGAPLELIDVTRDVSLRMQLEAELRDARDAAEAAVAVKSDFMANMSHEIRTPLTAILGFTTLLSEGGGLDETAQTYVRRVAGAGEALRSIVNDILDFSKLEAGLMEIAPRPVDPADMLREALLLFSPQADAKDLALEFASTDLPDWVSLDPHRVRQILLNLVGNAIKFTETGSVRLVAAYDADREQLQVRVEDTGSGLSKAQQQKLFQRFSQVDASTTRRHGGTGLGLAISKGLTEAMGGTIGVSSTPGEGSCFFFSLDAPPAEAVEPVAGTANDPFSLEGVKLLVVDDNPMNRELARVVLGHLGAEVSEAADGLAAVEAAQACPYDVILLDIRMPGLDGPATLARLRGEPGPNRATPVLAFTADADLDRFNLAGFDGAVAKPVDPAALAMAIVDVVRWDMDDAAPGQARAPGL